MTVGVACGAAEIAYRSLLEAPNHAPSREIHTGWGSELSKAPPLQLICVLHSLLPFSQLRPTEWSPCPCLGLGHISKLVCPVPGFVELVLQAFFFFPLVGFMELLGTREACCLGSQAFAWSENQVGGNWSFPFGSCAGVYCSNRRLHLVHTPRSFLAGSTSLENENK